MCAIHQPNLFPRLSTLAKIFAADYWIVLDDVQFARRDYQHRARLATLDQPGRAQWLSISTHLPHGRSTLINQMVIVEPERCRRRTGQLIRQHYGSSPHWPQLRDVLDPVLDLFAVTDRTAVIAEASTRALLGLLGWQGEILHSSSLESRTDRSQRLADLAAVTGASSYLCGTGGMRYLDPVAFHQHGITVTPFQTAIDGTWSSAREVSSLQPLMALGSDALAAELLLASEQ
ncbi:WbqC family protein [Kitasatospora sp. MAA4]|uniref:WbqC family protein n=1 Tax=Kitasatospora sp. MAA4 TaxID=3035093 RepID=UPI00247695C3|nr:WbqC family protein [Kitasatospora sp. MAA4]